MSLTCDRLEPMRPRCWNSASSCRENLGMAFHSFAIRALLSSPLLVCDAIRGLVALQVDQSWPRANAKDDDLKAWYRNETRKASAQFVLQTKRRAFGNLHLKGIYCTSRSRVSKSNNHGCHILQKCLGEAGALDDLESCLRRAKPSFESWRHHTPHFAPELVSTFLDNTNTNPGSVLEFGSRGGGYLKDFYMQGAGVCVGIDTQMMGGLAWYSDTFDVSSGPIQLPLQIPGQQQDFESFKQRMIPSEQNCFDVILSLEVMQQIPRAEHCSVLNFLASQACSWIATSIAHIGQEGENHIASRAEDDYKEEWIRRGFVFEANITRQVRLKVQVKRLQTNLLVFKRSGDVRSVDCSIEKLFWFPYEDSTIGRTLASSPLAQKQQPPIFNSTLQNRLSSNETWHFTSLESVYLLTTIPSGAKLDKVLLRLFVQHYVSLGIQPKNFLILAQGTEERSVSELADWFMGIGVRFIRKWIGRYDSVQRFLEYLFLQEDAGITHSDQWVVLADSDELHEFRVPLPPVIEYLKNHSYNGLISYFADRVAPSGSLPEGIVDLKPLLTQYPLICPITRELLKGFDWKVVLFQAKFRAHNHKVEGLQACRRHVSLRRFGLSHEIKGRLCSHSIGGGPKIFSDKRTSSDAIVVVHHFKWTASVIPTLKQRAKRYKKLGLSWGRQSERFLGYLEGRTDNTLPIQHCSYVNQSYLTTEIL